MGRVRHLLNALMVDIGLRLSAISALLAFELCEMLAAICVDTSDITLTARFALACRLSIMDWISEAERVVFCASLIFSLLNDKAKKQVKKVTLLSFFLD